MKVINQEIVYPLNLLYLLGVVLGALHACVSTIVKEEQIKKNVYA